ncbi:MAG: hypothetical protein NTU49_10950 [Gammaproteobacteria bacterium]|nr:hypothetical protein [Gammaproteobacteria bacterium]
MLTINTETRQPIVDEVISTLHRNIQENEDSNELHALKLTLLYQLKYVCDSSNVNIELGDSDIPNRILNAQTSAEINRLLA